MEEEEEERNEGGERMDEAWKTQSTPRSEWHDQAEPENWNGWMLKQYNGCHSCTQTSHVNCMQRSLKVARINV